MRYRHITIGLITLSLITITFAATVAAGSIYYPNMILERKGKVFTFTIDASGGGFSGLIVDKSSIVLTIYVTLSYTVIIKADPSSVTLTESSIIVQFVKQDLPKSALASNTIGNIGSSGDTFYASGPSWTWSNVHY